MPDGAVNISLGQYKAGVDLSGNQYYAVRLDQSKKVQLGNATSVVMGVLQNKPVTNRAASIRVLGESYGVVTGTVAVMDRLAADASGHLVTTTTDRDEYIAIALDTHSGASTSIINVFVVGPTEKSNA